jgi:hypothetical protein
VIKQAGILGWMAVIALRPLSNLPTPIAVSSSSSGFLVAKSGAEVAGPGL